MQCLKSLILMIAVLVSTSLAFPSPPATLDASTYDITCLDKDLSGDLGWRKECSRLIEAFEADHHVPNQISVHFRDQPYYYHGPPAEWLAKCELHVALIQGDIFDKASRNGVAEAATSIVNRCVWNEITTQVENPTLGGIAAPLGNVGNLMVKVNKVKQPSVGSTNNEGPALVATT